RAVVACCPGIGPASGHRVGGSAVSLSDLFDPDPSTEAPPRQPAEVEYTRPGWLTRTLTHVGKLFALALEVVRLTFRRPFQVRELIEQFWFVASVSVLPAALVAIPFGAVIALQLGSLTVQIGAQSFTGAASVLAVFQQASPIVVALMISGAA